MIFKSSSNLILEICIDVLVFSDYSNFRDIQRVMKVIELYIKINE